MAGGKAATHGHFDIAGYLNGYFMRAGATGDGDLRDEPRSGRQLSIFGHDSRVLKPPGRAPRQCPRL